MNERQNMKNTCKSPKKIICFVLAFFVLMPMTTFARFLGIGEKSGQKEFEKGKVAYEVRDYKNAAASFLVAAEKGHDEAQFYIGMCYFEGKGVQRDLTKAIQCFRKSAEKGNSDAMFQLGECYFNGYGVIKDLDEAVNWYRQSASKGNAIAMVKLGDIYYEGKILEENKSEAFKLWKGASEKGNDNAMSRRAYCLFNGIGTEKNINEAIEWSRRAVQERTTYNNQDQQKKYVALRKAYESAEKGDVDAMMELGLAYRDGNSGPINGYLLSAGVEKDLKESTKWYRKAAENGKAEAMNRLGECYVHGYGVESDIGEAIKWYNKALNNETPNILYIKSEIEGKIKSLSKYKKCLDAANNGDINAMCEIGDCFLNREFRWILNDANSFQPEAIKWYRKAADKGSAEAMFKIWDFYRGFIDRRKEAFEWLKKSAEKGYHDAIRKLGDCYLNGEIVEADLKEAVKWYRLIAQDDEKAKDVLERLGDIDEMTDAAEQGDVKKMYELGIASEKERDIKKALNWIQKSAEKGYFKAQFWLGNYYRTNGNDINKAIQWTDTAIKTATKEAEQGNAEASYLLAEHYERNRYSDNAKKWYIKAIELYKITAEQGDAESQFMVGRCYGLGMGVAQSDREAVKWYKMAAEQGHVKAMYNLGGIYSGNAYGHDVTTNKIEAIKWWRKAEEHGDTKARDSIKKYYLSDLEKQYVAAEQGDANSQEIVGLNYYKAKDYPEAVKWFEKSAAQGNAEAMNKLGECYYNGFGVDKDEKESATWDQKAIEKSYEEYENGLLTIQEYLGRINDFARQGNKEAKKYLDNLKNNK